MKKTRLSLWAAGALSASAVALVLSPLMHRHAHAFGGLWSSQREPVEQSALQVIFIDNPGPTVTALIRVEYHGPAQQFAWLIPVPGRPTVETSSSTVFQRLDAATAPEYWLAVGVEGSCADSVDRASDGGVSDSSDPYAAPEVPVTVVDRGSVAHYEYATISVDQALDDPAQAATDWLTRNGYQLPRLDRDALGQYLRQGLNVLALKLESSAEVGAVRPLMLTYDSRLPTIPIGAAEGAVQEGMDVQVWIVGPSQAVPTNYSSLVLNDALIDWFSGRRYRAGTLPAGGAGPFGGYVGEPSNYDSVVARATEEADRHGFVTELSGPASQYRDKVWSTLDEDDFAFVSGESYADGIDALVAASGLYAGWDGFLEAVAAAATLPSDSTVEQLVDDPERFRGTADIDTERLFELVGKDVVRPVSDGAAMLHRGPYLTRFYTRLSMQGMMLDPAFDYNAELAQVSNVHIARQAIECGPELDRDDAPWRIDLPQGGVVVGEGDDGWPVDEGSLPANLKIVRLSTDGSGTVLKDNSEYIGERLFEAAGIMGSDMPIPQLAQDGVLIGGTQTLTPYIEPDAMNESQHVIGGASAGGLCSAGRAGSDSGTGTHALSWLFTVPLAWLRRWRSSRPTGGQGRRHAVARRGVSR